MAQAVSRARFIPYTFRKVGWVASKIRGKTADEALTQLHFIGRRAADPLKEILRSAVANLSVKVGRKISPKEVQIVECLVNQGPVLKRIHPGSMGRAMPYKKRLCHLTMEVTDQLHGTKSKS